MSVSIFALRKGSALPLHDHPEMHGFLKCIHGSLEIKCFSKIWEKRIIPEDGGLPKCCAHDQKILMVGAQKEADILLQEGDGKVAVLQVNKNNVHEIRAVDGDAAFIDFLAPPYNNQDRDCHFFTVDNADHINDFYTLKQIDTPSSYYCHSAPYRGPSLN